MDRPNLSNIKVPPDSSETETSEAGTSSSAASKSGPQPQDPTNTSSAGPKTPKSVLFDTRSTTHSHNKKVQSGNTIPSPSSGSIPGPRCKSKHVRSH